MGSKPRVTSVHVCYSNIIILPSITFPCCLMHMNKYSVSNDNSISWTKKALAISRVKPGQADRQALVHTLHTVWQVKFWKLNQITVLHLACICRVQSIMVEKSRDKNMLCLWLKLRERWMLMLSSFFLFNAILQLRTQAQRILSHSIRVGVSSQSN